jgi:hypothetical protein
MQIQKAEMRQVISMIKQHEFAFIFMLSATFAEYKNGLVPTCGFPCLKAVSGLYFQRVRRPADSGFLRSGIPL